MARLPFLASFPQAKVIHRGKIQILFNFIDSGPKSAFNFNGLQGRLRPNGGVKIRFDFQTGRNRLAVMAKTNEQKTNAVGFPKPGELIEVTGAHDLEASDRAMLNVLYQFAHDAGNLTEQDAEWEMPLGRLRSVRHKGNERVRDSLQRLMKTSVTIPFNDPKTGEAKVLITPLFEFFELSADESVTRATLRFGLPRKLRPVIACSARWGRIKAEVVCSMSSRYAMALYELVQLRANMERCVEVFPVARFRELLGVPPGAYQRGNDFARKEDRWQLGGMVIIGL